MNNNIFIWFRTEYKRAANMLPSILKNAVILVLVCSLVTGMTVFGVKRFIYNGNIKQAVIKIGYVAGNDNMTNLAIKYVEGIASVQSLCRLERYELKAGMEEIKNNELDALIVLPDNVIEGILTGQNEPATIYMPASDGMLKEISENGIGSVGSLIFKELASAGIGMLKTAQAQIYVASDMAASIDLEDSDIVLQADKLQSAFDEINRYNLSMAITREKMFNVKNISATDNSSPYIYYSGAIFALYLMLAGLFVGKYCKRNPMQQRMFDKRLGISCVIQTVSQIFVATHMLFLVGCLPFLILFYKPIRESISFTVSLDIVGLIILILIMLAAYFAMIYQAVEKRELALLITVLSAFIQCYMSGCFIPTVLLPEKIAAVGKYVPAFYIRTVFTGLFGGSIKDVAYVITGVIVYTLIFAVVTTILMSRMPNEEGKLLKIINHTKNSRSYSKETGYNYILFSLKHNTFTILFKRLLIQKSIWITLAIMVIVSIGIVNTEQKSDTVIHVGCYDETGMFIEALQKHYGLVQFEVYDSESDLQKAVLRNEIECGYVIPDKVKGNEFVQAVIDGAAKKSVIVYEDADTITTDITNEIVFEKIFGVCSLQCFEQYILSSDIFEIKSGANDIHAMLSKMIEDKLNENVTFDVNIKNIASDGNEVKDSEITGSYELQIKEEDKNNTSYPIAIVVVIAMMMCAIQSLVYITHDFKNNRFYKSNKLVIAGITIFQSVALCFAAGVISFICIR